MRVLHLCAGNLYGGIERLLLTLARQAAVCPGMQPHFALCFEGRLSLELRDTAAPVHELGHVRVRNPWTVWRARRRLAALLRQELFDVVLCHGCWAHALFAPIVHAGQRTLVFWAHSPHHGDHWLERWARRIPPRLVLANSRFTQSHLHLFSGVLSEVLYLPVQPPDINHHDPVRQQVRDTLQTPGEAVVILQASRLERWKGQSLLLEALGRLKDLSNWACWMVGGTQRPRETAYLEELKASAATRGILDRVHFLGHRSDVGRLLAAADIFCQPNLAPEPFGVVFVEALYARRPVVTAAMGGALEIMDDTCGVFVPPGDTRALAATLRQLILDTSLRSRLGAAGPDRARALCEPARQMARLRDLLARTVGQSLQRDCRTRKPDLSARENAK